MELKVEGRNYKLEFDHRDRFVSSDLKVAYCSQLADCYVPILLDPKEFGNKPHPPELIAYRLIVNSEKEKLCILYEVYWKKQDCTWKELNKDHDHDYEQIQIHFNLVTGEKEKVIVSSVGPIEYAGHGVEVYSQISKPEVRDCEYITSPKEFFPWGSSNGQKNITQIREMPIERLCFEKGRPTVIVLNCYHVFVGLKREISLEERKDLNPRLEKLDKRLLKKWYYRHSKNRFGHDLSKPFEEPYVMYYPPPEDWKSRLVYGILWIFFFFRRFLAL